ncbi:unnamed protein product [Heligmosomoides polygyrus]|uniref:Ig-like domain-containing protein n=1 Tax=Heligmosomoides polygyrus TaxID=6339 RepID=A0A183GJ99_HELPZ|nr:unnamed protein product [Heligmosomoides polygyrus]
MRRRVSGDPITLNGEDIIEYSSNVYLGLECKMTDHLAPELVWTGSGFGSSATHRKAIEGRQSQRSLICLNHATPSTALSILCSAKKS